MSTRKRAFLTRLNLNQFRSITVLPCLCPSHNITFDAGLPGWAPSCLHRRDQARLCGHRGLNKS